jgi:hypothetical protein
VDNGRRQGKLQTYKFITSVLILVVVDNGRRQVPLQYVENQHVKEPKMTVMKCLASFLALVFGAAKVRLFIVRSAFIRQVFSINFLGQSLLLKVAININISNHFRGKNRNFKYLFISHYHFISTPSQVQAP